MVLQRTEIATEPVQLEVENEGSEVEEEVRACRGPIDMMLELYSEVHGRFRAEE